MADGTAQQCGRVGSCHSYLTLTICLVRFFLENCRYPDTLRYRDSLALLLWLPYLFNPSVLLRGFFVYRLIITGTILFFLCFLPVEDCPCQIFSPRYGQNLYLRLLQINNDLVMAWCTRIPT